MARGWEHSQFMASTSFVACETTSQRKGMVREEDCSIVKPRYVWNSSCGQRQWTLPMECSKAVGHYYSMVYGF